MSGIVGSAGSKSKLFNFFGYIQVPFATTTIGTSETTMALTNQVSSVGMPRNAGFTVSDSDETITIHIGGVYQLSILAQIHNNGASRENYINAFKANGSVPTSSSTCIMELYYVDSNAMGAQNYYSVAGTAIFEATGTNTQIKFFGRMVNDSAILQIETAHAQSCVTLIKLD